MKRQIISMIALFMGALFFLQGCSSGQLEVAENIKVPEGKAVIFFFRTGKGGGAIKFHVHTLEGKPVGYLGKSGDSFSLVVDPGTHHYWSKAVSRNDVILTVEAGKVYYVKATIKMGAVVGRPVLEQVSLENVPK